MRKLLKTLLGMTALLAHSVLFAASHNGYTTVDWAAAETLIALGEPPLAVGDMQSYQTWVKQPELPKTTVDLGVRLQPNLELIATLSHSADDLNLVFINSNFYASLNNLLRPYAQVHNVDFYQAGDAWQNVLNATRTIGQIIGKPQAVQQLLAQYKPSGRPPMKPKYARMPPPPKTEEDRLHLRILQLEAEVAYLKELRKLRLQEEAR